MLLRGLMLQGTRATEVDNGEAKVDCVGVAVGVGKPSTRGVCNTSVTVLIAKFTVSTICR
jgi:hypothetical protein